MVGTQWGITLIEIEKKKLLLSKSELQNKNLLTFPRAFLLLEWQTSIDHYLTKYITDIMLRLNHQGGGVQIKTYI